ncbi:transposase [Undibacterium sp. Di26W]|uniref:transposase n=1 Tax=Undibacterium sp. Di26W TaxID=3413035 RepID=UPI003BF08FD3
MLRPGKRPFGAENAMIVRRVLQRIRRHFPDTHVLVRGNGLFSGPELMGFIDAMPNVDFIFGFSCNVKLLATAEPTRLRAVDLWVAAQSQAQPATVISRLFKIAVQVRQTRSKMSFICRTLVPSNICCRP